MNKPIGVSEGRFRWMRDCRWTIREIKGTFQVPSAIARHIQVVAKSSGDAIAIAVAHHELCNNQVGY